MSGKTQRTISCGCKGEWVGSTYHGVICGEHISAIGGQLAKLPPEKPKYYQPQTTALQAATIALNEALDTFWMDRIRGLGLTGMGEHHMLRITDAQRQCREALEAEGVLQNV